MARAGRTKEEQYVIELYKRTVQGSEDSVDIFDLGSSLGQSERQTKYSVQALAQANFIRKLSKTEIAIAPRGVKLAEELLGID